MKTVKTVSKNIFGASMVFALAIAALLPLNTSAADETKPMKPMKGGEHMLMLNKVETKQDLDALRTDDSVAMVCAKCKTVWVSRVKQGVKGAQLLMANSKTTELIGTHACAGCGGTWTITGVGKGAKTELKHSCSMCGDDSGFCCATKPGEGATKGMDEEKK